MFRKRAFNYVTLVGEALLAALVLAGVWMYRSTYLATWGSGLGYLCIAICLPLSSASRPPEKRVRENGILLAAAYLMLIVSMLNLLAANTALRPVGPWGTTSIWWAILISLLYAVIQLLAMGVVLLSEDLHFPLPPRARRFLSGALLGVFLTLVFGVAFLGGGSLVLLKTSSHEPVVIYWNPYQIAMMFCGCLSAVLGYLLAREIGIPRVHRPRAIGLLFGLIILTAFNEYFIRGDWLLFGLSSMALVGIFFTVWEALAFVSAEVDEPWEKLGQVG